MDVQLNTSLLKELRSKKLWSQEQLAAASGLSVRTIARVEKDGTAASETAKALASVFEVSIDSLLAPVAFQGYSHKQFGWVIVLITFIVLTLVLILRLPSLIAQGAPPWVFLAIVLPAALISYLFSSLSISVDAEAIRWHFGPGIHRKSEKVVELLRCETVKNKHWWGLGIRFLPDGIWLYNVSGTDAVEVTLKSGRRFRLGTDEPFALQEAIERAIVNYRNYANQTE
jgi:transcriptional regulator with XRE-family HTH domain